MNIVIVPSRFDQLVNKDGSSTTLFSSYLEAISDKINVTATMADEISLNQQLSPINDQFDKKLNDIQEELLGFVFSNTNIIDTALQSIVEDTTPQLGGNLDVNGFSIITNITNANIALTPNGTGNTILTTGNLILTEAGALVDGRDLTIDGTKLDGIETAATADQTGPEIKVLYEAEANAFTDTQFTKLAGIETAATADQTAADIRTLGFFDTTNDGTGSGFDADLLDGNHSTAFATSAQGSLADSALQSIVGDTTPELGGELDALNNKIINLAAPTLDDDAARKVYVDDADALLLPLTGGTLTGALIATTITTSGNVGINETSPDAKLHITTANSSVSTPANVNAIIESNTTAYLQFQTPNSVFAGLLFGDPEDNDIGMVRYNHSNNNLEFRVGGFASLTMSISGISGFTVASAAEADAGTLSKFVTPVGVEETRKRLRRVDTSITTSQNFVAGWAGEFKSLNNNSAITLTIQQDTMTAGDVITFGQNRTTQVTIAVGAGVTLRAPNGAKTAGQYSVISVIMVTDNLAWVTGDTTS